MKRMEWSMLAIFSAAAVGLRAWHDMTGYEESGLPIRGSLPGLLLPVLLAAAALFFCIEARRLPARRDAANGTLGGYFPFRNAASAALAVMGAFLLLAGAALGFTGQAQTQSVIQLAPPVLEAAAALSLLYAVFGLRRGGEVQGLALLVPICALVVQLVLLYRADASDPFLSHIYVELLAVAALTVSAIQLAALALSDGAPRAFVPASALAVILTLAAAADRLAFADEARGADLASLALLLGCALLELGFLAAAELDAPKAKVE